MSSTRNEGVALLEFADFWSKCLCMVGAIFWKYTKDSYISLGLFALSKILIHESLYFSISPVFNTVIVLVLITPVCVCVCVRRILTHSMWNPITWIPACFLPLIITTIKSFSPCHWRYLSGIDSPVIFHQSSSPLNQDSLWWSHYLLLVPHMLLFPCKLQLSQIKNISCTHSHTPFFIRTFTHKVFQAIE